MSDKPILFSAPMVRAILEGRKSMTRRVLARNNVEVLGSRWGSKSPWDGLRFTEGEVRPHSPRDLYLPFCHPDDEPLPSSECGIYRLSPVIEIGDRLWVREAYSGPYYFTDIAPRHWKPTVPIWYWADGNPDDGDWTKPKPGIHMPRWASRLTLTVTDVRVQRINDIKGRDIIAEGVRCDGCYDTGHSACRDGGCFAQRAAFENLWDGINGLGSMASNPWIVAYTFTVEHRNIDARSSHDL